MSKTFKNPKHTYIKNNIYYFSRSAPGDLRRFYIKHRIVQSLRTGSHTRASTASKMFYSKLEDYWLGLRLKQIKVPASHLLVTGLETNEVLQPTILDALESYISVKGRERQPLFQKTARRHINYFIEHLGVRSLDKYSSKNRLIYIY